MLPAGSLLESAARVPPRLQRIYSVSGRNVQATVPTESVRCCRCILRDVALLSRRSYRQYILKISRPTVFNAEQKRIHGGNPDLLSLRQREYLMASCCFPIVKASLFDHECFILASKQCITPKPKCIKATKLVYLFFLFFFLISN